MAEKRPVTVQDLYGIFGEASQIASVDGQARAYGPELARQFVSATQAIASSFGVKVAELDEIGTSLRRDELTGDALSALEGFRDWVHRHGLTLAGVSD